MTDEIKTAIRAVLSRAADLEARRLDVIRRGDDAAREGIERELQQLYHQHQELEARARAA